MQTSSSSHLLVNNIKGTSSCANSIAIGRLFLHYNKAIIPISFQVKPVSVQPRVGPSNDLFNASTADWPSELNTHNMALFLQFVSGIAPME